MHLHMVPVRHPRRCNHQQLINDSIVIRRKKPVELARTIGEQGATYRSTGPSRGLQLYEKKNDSQG